MAPDGRPLTGASVRAAVGLPISLDPLPELTRVQTAWWPLMQRKIRSPGWEIGLSRRSCQPFSHPHQLGQGPGFHLAHGVSAMDLHSYLADSNVRRDLLVQ